MRILFDSKNEKYKKPFGALKSGQVCFFNILVPKSCPAKKVYLVIEKDGETETHVEMSSVTEENEYISFQTRITIDEPGLYFYWFFIEKEKDGFRLLKEGYCDTNMEAGDKWQLLCYDKNYHSPDWAKGAVIYQIFPDRFNKCGCPDLKSKLTPFYLHENHKDNPNSQPDAYGNWNNDFFGGNLQGIIEKLDYIKDLGADIIYLNPIVKAFSNHRYDTADYKAVDPMLGTTDDFSQLCNEAHKRNIRIIIDGVFSHTGNKSIYFESAINNENSPYRDWYDFKSFPNEYTAWWGIKTLPQIKKGHPDFMNFIVEDVVEFWLKLGADGVRLDVADELTDEFIEKLSKKAKELKKDALIMGEVWEDASNKISYSVRRKYLLGYELDSVMNYPFLNAIVGFVKGEKSSKQFAEEIMTIVENYPKEILNCCMNMLSTHDTVRIITLLKDSKKFDSYKLLKIAAFLQFMLPGAPSIYYGDEIGMEGEKDPFNRRYFEWDKVDCELHVFYKKLCELKHKFNQLKFGNIRFEDKENILLFYRDELKIIVNMTELPYDIDGDIIFCENFKDRKIDKYGFAIVK